MPIQICEPKYYIFNSSVMSTTATTTTTTNENMEKKIISFATDNQMNIHEQIKCEAGPFLWAKLAADYALMTFQIHIFEISPNAYAPLRSESLKTKQKSASTGQKSASFFHDVWRKLLSSLL
jgi:hypothetical protein